MQLGRHFVADRAVWSNLIVVSTPSFAFSLCLVEAQEPGGVQALGSDLAIEGFDEGIVRWLARPTEVERHILHEGPKIEFLADKFGSVVDPDRLRIARTRRGALERLDDIATAVAESHVDRRREAGEGVDHSEDTDLLTVEELVMQEVHGPDLVRFLRHLAIAAELRFDPSFG